jgi:hypothetical protein
MLFNFKTTQELTGFLVSKKITPTQAYFCHLLYYQDISSLYRYVHEFQQFTNEEVTDLEDRGYIVNQDYHSKTKAADMYVVTELLLDGLNLLDESHGLELWTQYPNFITVNNLKVPAKSCDRDTLIRDYSRKVLKSKEQHRHIMAMLEYAKRHNLITMGIRKWVDSYQWEAVEQVIQQEPPTSFNDVEFK